METYNSLYLVMDDPKQASFFLDHFIDEMGGEKFVKSNGWDRDFGRGENIAIDQFRREGGELLLSEFTNEYGGFFEREYRNSAIAVSGAFPQANFFLSAELINCSGSDGCSIDIKYENHVLTSTYIAGDCFEKSCCFECGKDFSDMDEEDTLSETSEDSVLLEGIVNLRDWCIDGKREVCPNCGAPLFDESKESIIFRVDSQIIASSGHKNVRFS